MKKIYYFLLFFLITIFIISPNICMDGFFKGIIIWGQKVVPALFPFFFITTILNQLGFSEIIAPPLSKITTKLYKSNGISGYIYAMSILSGYPMGAKLTSEAFEKKLIDKGQAIRICSFTSTSGPLFIIGTIGIGFLNDYRLGIMILVCHYLSALLNGFIYRNYSSKSSSTNSKLSVTTLSHYTTTKDITKINILEDAMLSSIKNIFLIGGYICIFFMLINLINSYNLLLPINMLLGNFSNRMNLPFTTPSEIINGLIEVTNGTFNLSQLKIHKNILLPMLSALVSFGGFSVHFQAYIFLKKIGIKFSLYLLQKATQMLFAIIISIIFSLIFL